MINEKFTKKHRFRRIMLERLIYIRNVNSMLNYIRLIINTVKIKIFLKNIKRKC